MSRKKEMEVWRATLVSWNEGHRQVIMKERGRIIGLCCFAFSSPSFWS